MPEWFRRQLPEGWSDRDVAVAAILITVSTAVVSLIGVGLAVIRIPETYFVSDHPPPVWAERHPFIRWPLIVLKNLLGVFLVILGVLLSVPGVPGQGFLTILIGAMLIDFPGKRRVEKWLLRRRGVLTGINRIRCRYGRPPPATRRPPRDDVRQSHRDPLSRVTRCDRSSPARRSSWATTSIPTRSSRPST
jgi:hypothetical protein